MESAEAPRDRGIAGPLFLLLLCALILQGLFLFEARVASDYGLAVNWWRDGIHQLFEPVERVFGAIPRDEGDSNIYRIKMFMGAHTLAFLIFAGGSWLTLERLRGSRVALLVIVVSAIAFRATFVMSPPLLENSINRYIWDGVVGSHLINPYRYSPKEILEARLDPNKRLMYPEPQRSELLQLGVASHDELRTSFHFQYVTYPDLRTIYPPLAQLYFATAAAVDCGNQDVLKLFNALVDLATLGLIMVLLVRMGRDVNECVIYAWSPLVIKEFSNSGHVDGLACFFVVVTVLYVMARRPALAGAAIAMGTLAKVYPIVLGVVFWKRLGRVGLVVMGGLIIIGLTPQATETDLRYQGFAAYARHWEANSSLQALVSHAMTALHIEAPPPTPGSTRAANMPTRGPLTRGICIAVMGFLLLRISWMRQETPDDIARAALYAIGSVLFCSPVVLPWYVAWVSPLLPLAPSAAFHVFTYTAHLWYAAKWVIPEGRWYDTVHELMRVGEYAPVYWLLYRELRSRAKKEPGAGAPGPASEG